MMSKSEKENPASVRSSARVYRQDNITSQSLGREKGEGSASWFGVSLFGRKFTPSMVNRWKTNDHGMQRLRYANRLEPRGTSLSYVRFIEDFPAIPINNVWRDVKFSSRAEDKSYVVQTSGRMIQRCFLMTTDPGDLVLDPTCGSGTTAYVAEQWGRRWITIDTSRVALALARARIMGARYSYYVLADSKAGQQKEAEVTRTEPSTQPAHGDIRQGFVYQPVPHVTLKSIDNNAEIDVIWEEWQPKVQDALERLNAALRGHKTAFKPTAGCRANKPIRFDAPEGETFTMPSGEAVPAYELHAELRAISNFRCRSALVALTLASAHILGNLQRNLLRYA